MPQMSRRKKPISKKVIPPPQIQVGESRTIDGEWVNNFQEWRLKINGSEVIIQENLTKRGQWEVFWDGALDYSGNKKDMLKRYPELRGYV